MYLIADRMILTTGVGSGGVPPALSAEREKWLDEVVAKAWALRRGAGDLKPAVDLRCLPAGSEILLVERGVEIQVL